MLKFNINAANLSNALAGFGDVIRNGVMPILDCILLYTDDKGHMGIFGTDLEIMMKRRVFPDSLEGVKDFKVAIPAQLFIETVKTFGIVDLEVSVSKSFQVVIKSATAVQKMQGLNGNDYPSFKKHDPLVFVDCDKEDLVNALSKAAIVTATKDLVTPALNGVHLFFEGKEGYAAGTDRYRLMKAVIPNATVQVAYRVTESVFSCVIPKRLAGMLKRFDSDAITLMLSSHELTIAGVTGDLATEEVSTSLLAEKYPNCTPFFHKITANAITALVDKALLLQALKRASLVSHEKHHQITLLLRKEELRITAVDNMRSCAAQESVPCTAADSRLFDKATLIEITVNGDFLLSLINAVASSVVAMTFQTKADVMGVFEVPDGATIDQMPGSLNLSQIGILSPVYRPDEDASQEQSRKQMAKTLRR